MITDVGIISRFNPVRRIGRERGLLIFGTAALALSSVADAQTTTGSIRGYVRSETGAPIADAQVAVRNQAMGLTRGTITNASGFYNLAGLRPAEYELNVRRLGFTAQTRTVQVEIGQTYTLDIQLQQAATQLSAVVVTGEAGAESRTSEVGTNISREQIQNLPSSDRNFLDFTKARPWYHRAGREQH